MTRAAVVGSLEVLPWLPLYGGILEALRSLGIDARAFRCGPRNELALPELRTFAPDLVVLPVCRPDVEHVDRFLAALKPDCKVILATFDDPYDLVTGLALVPRAHAVLTPEPLAEDAYLAAGAKLVRVLPPPIDGRMHFPPATWACGAPAIHVAHVGSTHWLPRRTVLPPLRDAVRRAGLVYGEIAGNHRFVAGEELTAWLHSVRVLLDIPRFEYATKTNPELIPCTYTTPRCHIAAACGILALVVGPRPDIGTVYPSFPVCTLEQIVEATLYWADNARNQERLGRAYAARGRWFERWQPSREPATVIAELLDALLGDGWRSPGAGGRLPAGESNAPPASAIEDAPGARPATPSRQALDRPQ